MYTCIGCETPYSPNVLLQDQQGPGESNLTSCCFHTRLSALSIVVKCVAPWDGDGVQQPEKDGGSLCASSQIQGMGIPEAGPFKKRSRVLRVSGCTGRSRCL